jgi:hypothetical protein
MKHFFPISIAIRVIAYAAMIYGFAEAIRFDAINPWEEGYYGEISRTEISQEVILFALFLFYLVLGYRHRPVQPVANLVSLLMLMSLIRELNFVIHWWFYPVLAVLAFVAWLLFRDRDKIRDASVAFFSQPASAWFLSGLLITFVFSRLLGRSKFWLLLYDENTYRMAKAATEEGIELLGDGLMLIGAIEFALALWNHRKADVK